MANLTLKIDDSLLKKARKVAIEKNTSVTSLVRNYLEQVTYRAEDSKNATITKLKRLYSSPDIRVGNIDWTREELYE